MQEYVKFCFVSILLVLFGCIDQTVNPYKANNSPDDKDYNGLNQYSTLPTYEIQCTQATDCNSDPLDVPDGASKKLYLIWATGSCSEYQQNFSRLAVSNSITTNVAGLHIQYVGGTWTYANNYTTIPYGNYALWIGVDSSDNASIDVGEPVVCSNQTVDKAAMGSLALTSSWGNADSQDIAVFHAAGY